MLTRQPSIRTSRSERGVVLIVALVVATIFAVLAYIVLAVSIHSLDSTDSSRNQFTSHQVAEGAMNEAAYRLTENVNSDNLAPTYNDPSWALSSTESDLKAGLLQTGDSTIDQLDTFPATYQRSSFTTTDGVSTMSSETDVVPGDKDNAVPMYIDDNTFGQKTPVMNLLLSKPAAT